MGGAFDLIWRPSDEDPGDPPERPGETGNPTTLRLRPAEIPNGSPEVPWTTSPC